MKIIVFGATGYLGSKLVERLVDVGHEVLCLKRSTSSMKNLEKIANKIDVVNIEDFPSCLENEKYDWFINTTCLYPRFAKTDMDIFEANLVNPLRTFLEALNGEITHYMTIGTSLPNDFNVYCKSKKEFSELLKWYVSFYAERGKRITVIDVKLENFYGENEPDDRFIPGVIQKLKNNQPIDLTSGEQKRDWIYIGDVINMIVALLDNDKLPSFLEIPMGTGMAVPVREVILYLKEITKSSSELRFGAVEKRLHEPDTIADTSTMASLGLSVEYDWQEGMKKII